MRANGAPAMTIGEVAARAGFTPKAVRYYERIGLLPPPARRPSGYRLYGAADLGRLDFIAKAKRLGLSLDEIREVLALRDAGVEPCVHVLRVIERHVEDVEHAIAELSEFRAQLVRLAREARRRTKGGVYCGIIEHASPAAAVGDRARVALEFGTVRRQRANHGRKGVLA